MTEMWTITAQGPKRAVQTAANTLMWADPSPASAVSHFEITRFQWRMEALAETEALAQEAVALAAIAAPEIECRVAPLVQEDWIAKSLEGLPAVPVGRFIVAGEHAAPKSGSYRRLIRIEAGEAFGTGHHGTTKGCLHLLEYLARRKNIGRVLDLGGGTGVLAISAVRAGATFAAATDIDARATEVAARNAKDNRAPLRALTAAGFASTRVRKLGRFDLVFANILMKPLIRLSPDVIAALRPGGYLILSGILEEQEPLVRDAYQNRGLVFIRRKRIEGWSTLLLRKPGGGHS
jgi:ribosomal protein L11 methyltransferase